MKNNKPPSKKPKSPPKFPPKRSVKRAGARSTEPRTCRWTEPPLTPVERARLVQNHHEREAMRRAALGRLEAQFGHCAEPRGGDV